MTTKPRIYADFQNADAQGRLRLTCAGTLEDLARQKIELCNGLLVTLYADDLDASGNPDELFVDGSVTFSAEENCWVATIDWSAIRHSSNGPVGALASPPADTPAQHRQPA